jgi:hypothetical protein
MVYYANEVVLTLGGLSPAIVFIVTIMLAFAYIAWPQTKLPHRKWLLMSASIPLALAVLASVNGWRHINETCFYLQQQDAISNAQVQLFLDGSKRANAWLIMLGAIYSTVLWTLINWRTKRKTPQTNSVHQATRA